jgi:hypothetical protein
VEQLGSTAVCDLIFIYICESQDLTLHTMLSDGVAIVGQTFAVGFERYRLVTTIGGTPKTTVLSSIWRRPLLVTRGRRAEPPLWRSVVRL